MKFFINWYYGDDDDKAIYVLCMYICVICRDRDIFNIIIFLILGM